ncbi:DUF4082 domain-containing protein [Modestobacter sp. I12A-02628]|uniref:DUF4082 domain-containing protein n=1 Tax=Goekera deserti TaxID=2497753 RepID=A0A7K3WGU3_9ACTN|nr:DUF4082 domain-containing protein [Goekera deserti]MPQ99441.1 DUF4082 domain-containing protein [Goekera deserti]NDI48928.1 DUF4082 domain-containing protein [Goekera deserti]NEL55602.1 DUF4082 domain-containing protein [Goekera deserti]
MRNRSSWRLWVCLLASALVALLGGGAVHLSTVSATQGAGVRLPLPVSSAVDDDRAAVTLGVRFTPAVDGVVTAVEFRRATTADTARAVQLWDAATGAQLAAATGSGTRTGTVSTPFAAPVPVLAGRTYVASYLAPRGRYSATVGWWDVPRASGPLSAPAGAGVYHYGRTAALPQDVWRSSDYGVTPVFRPGPTPVPTTTAPTAPTATTPATLPGTTAPAPTTPPPTTAAPTTPAPTTTTAPGTTAGPAPTTAPATAPAPSAGAPAALADLPRVPWNGGPAYWSQFPATAGTRLASADHFPIMYWGAYVDDQQRVDRHAAAGITTYGELYATDAGSAARMRSAGIQNLGWDPGGSGTEWVGRMYADEADMWAGTGSGTWTGRWPGQGTICTTAGTGCAQDVLRRQQSASVATDGRVRYLQTGKGANMWWPAATAADYVNGTPDRPVDVTTASMYWYTDANLHGGDPAIPGEATTFYDVPRDQVHRAANYGQVTMARLRQLDAADGRYTAIGTLVELGQQNAEAPGDFAHATMTPDRIEGAVWSSLIGEARIVGYFSHGFGTQPTPDALTESTSSHYRSVQARVTALDARIQALAPVLNTQSYAWDHGSGTVTMTKAYDGHLYVFAQQARSASTSGTYTFALPPGVSGSVEVLDEGRTLDAADGSFTDAFAQEHTTHVYRVRL